ncbi:MAG: hypothetical protein Q8P95_00380 [bacterium]|nr:hypothetical protein [bacterium]
MKTQTAMVVLVTMVAMVMVGCQQGSTISTVNQVAQAEPLFEQLKGEVAYAVARADQPMGTATLRVFESAPVGSFSALLRIDAQLVDPQIDPVSDLELEIDGQAATLQSVAWLSSPTPSAIQPPNFAEEPGHHALVSFQLGGTLDVGLHELALRGDLQNLVPRAGSSTRTVLEIGREFLFRSGAERQRVTMVAEVLPLPPPELSFTGGTFAQPQVRHGQYVELEGFTVAASDYEAVMARKVIYRLSVGRDVIVDGFELVRREAGQQQVLQIQPGQATYEEGQHQAEFDFPGVSHSRIDAGEEVTFLIRVRLTAKIRFHREGFVGYFSASLIRDEVVIEPSDTELWRRGQDEFMQFELLPLTWYFEAQGGRSVRSAANPGSQDGVDFFVPDRAQPEATIMRGLSFRVTSNRQALFNGLVGQRFYLLDDLGQVVDSALLQFDGTLEFHLPWLVFRFGWRFSVVTDMTAAPVPPQIGDSIRFRMTEVAADVASTGVAYRLDSPVDSFLEYGP